MKITNKEKQYRFFHIERAHIDEEKRTANLAFSSEEPVERFFGVEILDHTSKSVRLGRLKDSGPLLMDHNSRDQVGVIEKVSIDSDRIGRAVVRFGKSTRAEEIFQDVLDGIRTKVSVGYMVHEMIREKEKKGEAPVFRVTDWEPLEISMVSVPADQTVGIGRNVNQIEEIFQRGDSMTEEEKKKIQEEERQKVLAETNARREEEKRLQEQETEKIRIREDARKEEQERIKEISAIGDKLKKREEAQTAIHSGMSVDQFREKVLKEIMDIKPVETTAEIGLSRKETDQFSVLRAVNSILETGNLEKAPFERECSAAVQKNLRKSPRERGLSIPWEVLNKRDLTANVNSAGGYLVDTTLMSMIDLLRNSMMVARMGATVLDGLMGDIAFPKHTGAATSYWVNEGGAPTESQQVFGQIGLSPKTVGAFTDYSRKLLLQSSVDVENLVRMDLALVVAIAIDLAAINGAGANGEPLGILNTTGIGAVVGGTNGAAPTWANMVNLEKEVAKDNALIQSLGYLTNSDMVGKLKVTEKAANTAQFIMTGPNGQEGFMSVNGYRAGVSNQVPNNLTKGSGTDLSAIIFGNWRDLIIGNWGTADILVDPYTGGTAGNVRVRILRDTDIRARRAESFSAMTDAITS